MGKANIPKDQISHTKMYTAYIAQGERCDAPSMLLHWCIELNDAGPQTDILETLVFRPGF